MSFVCVLARDARAEDLGNVVVLMFAVLNPPFFQPSFSHSIPARTTLLHDLATHRTTGNAEVQQVTHRPGWGPAGALNS